MKLSEYLTYLLFAQAHTLQRLAAFFGEEEFLEILENIDDRPDLTSTSFQLNPNWFIPSMIPDQSSAYRMLEGTVSEFKISPTLEFYLWAYPYYRSIIESSLNLNSEIRLSESKVEEELINHALEEAKYWVKNLPLSPDQSRQAEQIALVPWLRFRTEVLKKSGKNPFAAV